MGDEDPTTGDMSADEPAADDEEIDLDELLAELEATTAEGKHKDDEKMEEGEHKDKKDEAMHSKKKDKAMEEETSTQVEAESDGALFVSANNDVKKIKNATKVNGLCIIIHLFSACQFTIS
jgi:hypothetical protein